MTMLIVITELHPVTDGCKSNKQQSTTGPSSWSQVKEEWEEGLYEQVKIMMGKPTETVDPS